MSNDMHPDLKWLAENVSEWPSEPKAQSHGIGWHGWNHDDRKPDFIRRVDPLSDEYSEAQWLQARRDLGLVMSDEEAELPAQEWSGSITDSEGEDKYGAYFRDVRHLDKIDVYRAVDLFGCEKHGHPISHAAKKLLLSGSRTGGKDVEEDVREAIDTLTRWLEMREEDRGKM